MSAIQPFQYKPYQQGVLGALWVQWLLELKTPLLIRANQTAAMRQGIVGKKGRGTEVEIAWENAERKLEEKVKNQSKYSQLIDFNYHFAVQNRQVTPLYHIPASSVRGALRNAAIKRLVEIDNRRAFTLKIKKGQSMKELEEQVKKARELLEQQRDGWYDVLSLFGCAFDPLPGDTPPLIWAGRLRLDTALETASASPTIDCVDSEVPSEVKNMRGHVMVRNPIDRVSMSAKEGGLHFALEMSPGQQFRISMHILNPCSSDTRLLNMWREDLNDGYVRFGGLTSQGRGKAEVVEENYRLYLSRSCALYPDIAAKLKTAGSTDLAKNDLLEGIWQGVELSLPELSELDFSKLKMPEGE